MQTQVSIQTGKDEIAALRREVGAWLKQKREAAGLSQRELAAKIGIDYYTFISQIEAGRGKVPADRYEAYANAVNVAPRDFCITMVRYLEPVMYRLMFDTAPAAEEARSHDVAALEERLRKLEARLGD